MFQSGDYSTDVKVMACGCSSSGSYLVQNGEYKKACPFHNTTEEMEEIPSLKGRLAKCYDCKTHATSSWKLPFFQYLKDKKTDSYYCGCHGWD